MGTPQAASLGCGGTHGWLCRAAGVRHDDRLPRQGFGQYDFIRRQTKDRESREEFEFPVEYLFKEVPKDLPTTDPIGVTLHEMDRFGIEKGLIGVADETSQLALKKHPDRFVPSGTVSDPTT
ncbi:hypothetical protein I552_2805 [Mycobacterium xenopi 3993]|nr:hypothetical protein I552_2805 [Mycobacterium xenopi 3993]